MTEILSRDTFKAGLIAETQFTVPYAAPASPANGDVWATSLGLYACINGVTIGPFSTGAGGLATTGGTLTGTLTIDMASNTTQLMLTTASSSRWALTKTSQDKLVLHGWTTGGGYVPDMVTFDPSSPPTTTFRTHITMASGGGFRINASPAQDSSAGLRIPHSANGPISPVNGDIWTTTAGVFIQINGATVGPLSVGNLTQTIANGLYVGKTGDTMSGDLTLSAPNMTARSILLATAGSPRWEILRSNSQEYGGPNLGSNFILRAYSDAGVSRGDVINIARDTLTTSFPFGIYVGGKTLSGVATPVATDDAANKAYVDLKAPLASPTFTGVPGAPTATVGTNTTQLATTAFVLANGGVSQATGDARYLQLTGGTVSGPAIFSHFFTLEAPSGTARYLGITTAGSWRWALGKTNAAESGSNAGADFNIDRYADNGSWVGTSLAISRSSGLVTVAADPVAALGVATKQYVDSRTPKITASPTAPSSPSVGDLWVGPI